MIDGKKICDQPVDNSIKHYDEVRKGSTGQGDNYTTICLLDYGLLDNYRSIAVDVSKQKP